MAITSYATLASAVAEYNPHSDTGTKVSLWVSLAEARMNREIRVRQQHKQETGSLAGATVTVPYDFLETVDFRLETTGGGYYELERRPLVDLYARRASVLSGLPVMFALDGTLLRVSPSPDSTYAYVWTYVSAIPGLESAGVNWLVTDAPDIYLYATLTEGERFLQNPDGFAFWDSQYQRARDSLIGSDRRGRWRGGLQAVRTL